MKPRNITISDLEPLFRGGNAVLAHKLRQYLRLSKVGMYRYMKRAGLSRPNAKYYLLDRQQVRHLIETMLEKEAHAA
jgi:hypothetical protein